MQRVEPEDVVVGGFPVEVIVDATSFHSEYIQVNHPALLFIQFSTANNNIGFEISRETEGKPHPILPYSIYDSYKRPFQKLIPLNQAGLYHICWHNEYSMFK